MIEDSPETFVQRWRPFAAEARLFARTEGSPLLEAEVGGAVLQLFERTNPYVGEPGSARVVVHPVVERIERADEAGAPGAGGKRMEVPARGALTAVGPVLMRDDALLVVDAGAPLVVAAVTAPPDDIGPGAWVRFTAEPPIHAFVLPKPRSTAPSPDDAL